MRGVGPVVIESGDDPVERFAIDQRSGAQQRQQFLAWLAILDAFVALEFVQEMSQQRFGDAADALRCSVDILIAETGLAGIERLKSAQQTEPAFRFGEQILKRIARRSKCHKAGENLRVIFLNSHELLTFQLTDDTRESSLKPRPSGKFTG